ncbi:MAG: double zinc ribbon domain-containing protein, partial [Caldimonas sp.]
DWGHSGRECASCEGKAGGGAGEYGAEQGGGPVCPNCQTPSQGGRFCHECGFDMASTHKSCPGCGATMARQARFCTDCGHGF